MTTATDRVWYLAYGSNTALGRFRYYLRGGPVPGGARDYEGCRDPSDPAAVARLSIAGGLVFAGRSRVWGGGMAFYLPDVRGEVACRAYLLTPGQLADVVAQEVRQPPGGLLALHLERSLPCEESILGSGSGLYDDLLHLGHHDGMPLYTITHSRVAALEPAAPSASYLTWIAAGLRDAHDWDDERIGDYLAAVPGAAGTWAADDIARLARGDGTEEE